MKLRLGQIISLALSSISLIVAVVALIVRSLR